MLCRDMYVILRVWHEYPGSLNPSAKLKQGIGEQMVVAGSAMADNPGIILPP